mgnify:CR=1 FL=1
MGKFLAAAVQIDSQGDKQENLAKIEKLIDEAAGRGAKLVGLPEMMNYIGDEAGEQANAESITGPTIQRLMKKARQHSLWLHCGSIFERIPGDNKLYNTTVLLDPQGEIAASYRKIHLFDVEVMNGPSALESRTKKPGREIVVVPTGLAKIGLSICYDLRFPEIYRIMALRGTEVFFVPAEFTLFTGKDHWETLLRARAIENQCYVIAPAQIGVKPRFQTYGKSMIVDPWGNVIAKSSDQEGIILAEIDLALLYRIRAQIPGLKNRKPESYQWE